MIKTIFRTLWRFLLDVAGENDYRRYRARTLARGETPLAPAAFYLASLEQKYSRPNRCC
ncbi:MAG TPA: CstA-like transporter-associated (seleno)protein [Terriglobia bacterium]|jgi:hypothetical protein|nr:CstA-like transporter-associated (seleno)protein [Terriglobia bacterium]